jgi:hypothetical protein
MPTLTIHSPFPMYFRHRDAVCHRCEGVLLDHSPTKYPPGRGFYRGFCETCGLHTWYDCAEGTVEMIEVRLGRRAVTLKGPTP